MLRTAFAMGLVAVTSLCGWSDILPEALSDVKDSSPLSCEVAPQGTLSVSGMVHAPRLTNRSHKAGILLVRYHSADGGEVLAKDLTFSPKYKCGYKYLAAGKVPEPFWLDLAVPDGAVRAEISVSRYACTESVFLSEFRHGFVVPGPDQWRTQILETKFNVQPGRIYEVSVRGKLSPADLTNRLAVVRCNIGFCGDEGELAIADSLVTGLVSGCRDRGLEYFFVDQARRERNDFCWRFQVRAPGGASRMMLAFKPWRNTGRILLGEPVVRPCAPTYDLVGDEESGALRWMVRCEEMDEVLCLEGRCCDTSDSPARGALNARYTPFAYSGEGGTIESPIELDGDGNIRHEFRRQPDCFGGMVEIRSATTNCCRIVGATLRGKSGTGAGVSRDLKGGVQRTHSLLDHRATVRMPKFTNVLLRSLSGKVTEDAILSQPQLVKQAVEEFWGAEGEELVRMRKDNPAVRVSPNHGLIIGPEYSAPTGACSLVIRDYEGVDMYPSMDWTMNPFTNSTWRLKFLSGYWIPFSGAAIIDERDYYDHCKAYWQSFMSRFSYPNGAGTIVYNSHACAARIEAILLTMYGKKWDPETDVGFPSLRKQLAQDPQFLRQLLYQLSVDVGLIVRQLRVHPGRLHNYNVIMATALLQFADCFRNLDFSRGYGELARRVIFEHLYLLFEPDGLLREQAAFYHHLFTRYFTGLYLHMRDNKSVDEKTLAAFKNRLARLVEVDFLMCPPDGMSVPMGDIPSNEMTRNECTADARELGLDAEQNPVFAGSFNSLPDISVFRESGIYIFRNPKKGRFLFVDLSDSLKVHGHRDLGSWQYYSQGVRWISDLGGPCEYGTKRHREFIASPSHTLVEPVGMRQASGVASDVELKDCGDSWKLSCRPNVYGPTVEHVKKFVIAKDLSTFSVTDAFPGLTGDVRGRLTLAPGCDVTVDQDERMAFLSSGDSSIKVILPKARSHEKLRANASLRSNRLSEVWLLDSLCSGQEPVTYVVRDEK